MVDRSGAGSLGIACWPDGAEQAWDAEALARRLRQAAAAGVDLLLTPAAPSGPSGAVAGLRSDAPELRAIAATCADHGVGLVLGYPESCSGRLHSAAIVIDGAGHALANYRACHFLPADERRFARGQWFTVLIWGSWRIGLMVGDDLAFPEAARCLVLSGADTLLVLGKAGRGDAARALARARAIENGLDLVMASKGGSDAAAAFAPDGTALGRTVEGAAGLLLVELRSATREPRTHLLTARRPRLYQRLASIDEP